MLEYMEQMAANEVSDSENGYGTEYSDESHIDLDDMDLDLAIELDGGEVGAALADHRTMCACLPGITFCVSEATVCSAR